MQGVSYRVLWAGVVLLGLCGCTTMTPRYFGIRPPEPSYVDPMSRRTVCEEFKFLAEYTQELKEAYLSRATQNRFWIYGAGTTALGTAAATAGVAAVAASSSATLVLLPIAGAFASGVFGVLNNRELADIYTIAGGRLEIALQEADAKLKPNLMGDRFADYDACEEAYRHLREAVAKAKNDLERARTDSASLALQRTAAQVGELNRVVKDVQDQNMAQAVQNGEITAIQPSEVVADGQEKEITLTISKVDISSIGLGHLKVKMGKETRNVISNSLDPGTGSYLVKFKAPGKPPAEDKVEYSPVLSVGSAQTEVRSRPGVSLKYKPVQ